MSKQTPEENEQTLINVSPEEFVKTVATTRAQTVALFKKLDFSSRKLTPAKLETLNLLGTNDNYVMTEAQLIQLMHLMFCQGMAEAFKSVTPKH
jgi:hypothetical protein